MGMVSILYESRFDEFIYCERVLSGGRATITFFFLQYKDEDNSEGSAFL